MNGLDFAGATCWFFCLCVELFVVVVVVCYYYYFQW